MKNIIATTVAAATLFAGSAAFAGDVIGADALEKDYISQHMSQQQATATVTEADVVQNGNIEHIHVTTIASNPALADQANFGS